MASAVIPEISLIILLSAQLEMETSYMTATEAHCKQVLVTITSDVRKKK